MAKRFQCRRSPAGVAIMEDTMNRALADLTKAEKRTDTSTILECLLSVGSLHYVVEDYEHAEAPLAEYVTIAKDKFGINSVEVFRGLWLLSEVWSGLNRIVEGMTAGAEAKSISRKIDCLTKDPAVETLFRRTEIEKDATDGQGRERAFVTALAALSLTITGGFHRSSVGGKVLAGLRVFFKSYGIDDEL
jgi:hypothetical protein